ncbi:hypothetical protein Poly21_01730 [Allorhodopirellula heiligendammensis]|uniref:Uncharacterized protein n=1 Tax=Allorhodopirellula heiligendammensis TaxID=2714739 RepID=A0A5C6C0F8_9BACT|nr:hypothetical protein Poly21_01730 [Allorhodopirellula heiligendammensis]
MSGLRVGRLRIRELYASDRRTHRHRVVCRRVRTMREAERVMREPLPAGCYFRSIDRVVRGERLGWKAIHTNRPEVAS